MHNEEDNAGEEEVKEHPMQGTSSMRKRNAELKKQMDGMQIQKWSFA